MQHKLPSVLVVSKSRNIKLPVNNSESDRSVLFFSLLHLPQYKLINIDEKEEQ